MCRSQFGSGMKMRHYQNILPLKCGGCVLGLVNNFEVPFSIVQMKIVILWASLAKKLIHFSQRRLSDAIFKYCKCTVFRLCPRFYKVTTSHHILATPFHKAMQFKHENLHIYRGVSLEKIPGPGQFLQS